jgi:hypothetical protein
MSYDDDPVLRLAAYVLLALSIASVIYALTRESGQL